MIKIKKHLALALALCTLVTSFVACRGGNDQNCETPDETNGIDVGEYTLVRPDAASRDVIGVTGVLKSDIKTYTDADLEVKLDNDGESEYEILIGETGRQESAELLSALKNAVSKKAFAISVTDKKIVIVGISDNDTVLGVKRFISSFVKTSTEKGTITAEVGYKTVEKTGDVLYFTDRYDAVVLERKSDVFLSQDGESCCSYAKIIKLEHQSDEKNNGILLATHETRDGNKPPVFISYDDGKNWEKHSDVIDTLNIGMRMGYQSYLYELPADVGGYKEGTLFFAGNTYNDRQTTMVLYVSTDVGKTWTTLCNVDVGGGYNGGDWSSDGLWEPVLMYEDGRLYCFYSDELDNGEGANHVGGYNQKLVYKYTTDLVSWSDKYDCTASEVPSDRPGMVALAKMGNGKWALAYEFYGFDGLEDTCPIAIKYADKLDAWDVAEEGRMIVNGSGELMGSGPAIAWTPNGGDCGTLFVTSVFSRGSNTGCDLYISFDYGETFISIDNPISVDRFETDAKCGYSAGFYVDEAGDLYYVNNPVVHQRLSKEKLSFAKIKIY